MVFWQRKELEKDSCQETQDQDPMNMNGLLSGRASWSKISLGCICMDSLHSSFVDSAGRERCEPLAGRHEMHEDFYHF